MYCYKCATMAPDDAQYCPRCGTEVAAAVRNPKKEGEQPDPRAENFRADARRPPVTRPLPGGPIILVLVILAPIVATLVWVQTLGTPNSTSNPSEAVPPTQPPSVRSDTPAETLLPALTLSEKKDITEGVGIAFLGGPNVSVRDVTLDAQGALTATIDSYDPALYEQEGWSDEAGAIGGFEAMFRSYPNAQSYRIYAPPSDETVSEEFVIAGGDLRSAVKGTGNSGTIYFNDDVVRGSMQHLVDGVKQ